MSPVTLAGRRFRGPRWNRAPARSAEQRSGLISITSLFEMGPIGAGGCSFRGTANSVDPRRHAGAVAYRSLKEWVGCASPALRVYPDEWDGYSTGVKRARGPGESGDSSGPWSDGLLAAGRSRALIICMALSLLLGVGNVAAAAIIDEPGLSSVSVSSSGRGSQSAKARQAAAQLARARARVTAAKAQVIKLNRQRSSLQRALASTKSAMATVKAGLKVTRAGCHEPRSRSPRLRPQ